MIATNKVSYSRYLLGAALVACLIMGGGTLRNLAVDSFLQVLIICAATFTIIELWDRPVSSTGLALFTLVLLSGLLQLVPLPAGLLQWIRPEIFQPVIPGGPPAGLFASISIGISRSLPAWMSCLSVIYLFIALSKLSERELLGLLPFYMCGLIANLAAVFVGYSHDLHAKMGNLFGYEAGSGFFANDNHLSTLLCASIPIVIYLGSELRRKFVAWFLGLSILISLLAIGSRAGILIGLGILILSFLQSAWRWRIGALAAAGLIVAITVYGYGAFVRIGGEDAEGTLQRWDFTVTTLRGIRENWLLGTGYGTFGLAYPYYEKLQDIYPAYVNHAHNDFLEVTLEGGLIGAALMMFYLAATVLRLVRVGDKLLARLSFLSICVVLVHSTVDYPLRTIGIAVSFAFFSALLFSRNSAGLGVEAAARRLE